ncbi:MAG: Trk system potassium transporter TrkA [Clostridia bacterium]|nr:Trk system potassium transporter TrkA [Clostridia bacterium]
MKIIIFGCGKIGTTLISSLSSEGHDIIAIDRNPKIIEEVTNIYDVIGLCGNGIDCDTMSEAGIEEAELFVAVTGSDELNMLGCFMAKKMGAKHTVARIRNPEYNDENLGFMKQQLSISVTLNPELSVAHEIFNLLRFPSATKIETFSERKLEIVDFHLKEGSPIAGQSLSELRRKNQAKFLVCDVVRNDEVFIPDGNFVLREGDVVGLTASHDEIIKLFRSLGATQKHVKSVMILGASRIAYYLAKRLLCDGITVKIIDKDPERCAEFSRNLPQAIMILGDGMDQEVLLEEGLRSTDAFISLTGTDEENILSSFFAVNQEVPTVITKVNRPEFASTAEKLGLDRIVSPKNTVSNVLSRYARALENSMGSNVETLYRLVDGKAEVLEFNVLPDFEYINIPLRDMKLKKNILIAGIIRRRKPIIPSGSDVIMPSDKVIVVASGRQLGDLSDIME